MGAVLKNLGSNLDFIQQRKTLYTKGSFTNSNSTGGDVILSAKNEVLQRLELSTWFKADKTVISGNKLEFLYLLYKYT